MEHPDDEHAQFLVDIFFKITKICVCLYGKGSLKLCHTMWLRMRAAVFVNMVLIRQAMHGCKTIMPENKLRDLQVS